MYRRTVMPIVLVMGLVIPLTPGPAPAQLVGFDGTATEGRHAIAGIWALNRDLSQFPDRDSAGSEMTGERGGGGSGGGGRRIRGGAGGGGAMMGGGGGRGGNPEQMQAVVSYLRALSEPSDRLILVVDQDSVGITDAEGRTEALRTDNKRVEGRAENGLVKLKRRARWDGEALVSEIDIDRGPTVRRRYELSPDGAELHVSTELRGMIIRGAPGSGDRAAVLVYERQTP